MAGKTVSPFDSGITAEYVRECLDYDPDTGVFRWRERPITHFRDGKQSAAQNCAIWNGKYSGLVAGSMNDMGYRKLSIDNQGHRQHRLAWFYVTGAFPAAQIDHINGIRTDNRIANLREATNAENHQNVSAPRDNTSGHLGVAWHSRARKWRAEIMLLGRYHYIGLFDTKEAASEAYRSAKKELHRFQPTPRDRGPSVKNDGAGQTG